MNTGGDAAEQVVRLSLEGFEVARLRKGNAMKKNIYVSIICFFLLVMIFSGVMIYSHFKEAHTQKDGCEIR